MVKWSKLALGAAAATLLAGTAAQAQIQELRFGLFFSDKANVVQKVLVPWAEWFEKESGAPPR